MVHVDTRGATFTLIHYVNVMHSTFAALTMCHSWRVSVLRGHLEPVLQCRNIHMTIVANFKPPLTHHVQHRQ